MTPLEMQVASKYKFLELLSLPLVEVEEEALLPGTFVQRETIPLVIMMENVEFLPTRKKKSKTRYYEN
jgi:hypothetical protein